MNKRRMCIAKGCPKGANKTYCLDHYLEAKIRECDFCCELKETIFVRRRDMLVAYVPSCLPCIETLNLKIWETRP